MPAGTFPTWAQSLGNSWAKQPSNSPRLTARAVLPQSPSGPVRDRAGSSQGAGLPQGKPLTLRLAAPSQIDAPVAQPVPKANNSLSHLFSVANAQSLPPTNGSKLQ